MTIEIKSLEGLTFNELYEAFGRAFADYAIKMTKWDVERLLRRRGFFPQLSFGAFANNHLVAFTFNGTGSFNNLKTAYDTGTGTVPEYRGQGLAKRIFQHSIPYLQKAGVKQYLLEVLQNNEKAVALYKKMGFEITREFTYFILDKHQFQIEEEPLNNEYTLSQVAVASTRFDPHFEDHLPSWQNSFDSINRAISDFMAFAVYHQEEMVAYCIFDPETGDITKLAIHPKHQGKGLKKALLYKAVVKLQNEKIKFINVPMNTALFNFLTENNFTYSGKQYEMRLKL